ncbi:MAG: hypothetical protein SOR57_11940 [Parabacteroides sp.]|nr:hypothetical protein [Parabacteroides sp.]
MGHYIYIIIFSLCPILLSAQWKAVEKSRKEQPVWVGGAERNYLIVSVEAPTIELAKEKLLLSLKEQIVSSIATHITSQTTQQRQELVSGTSRDYSENTTSVITSKVSHIPFVSEISLSKAYDFYWVKLYNKKTKEYKYEYHVKYRFTDFELADLVNQFHEREKQLNERLVEYSELLEQITSVEEIDRTLNELKAFLTEFDVDDSRRSQTEQLSNSYRQLYNYIRIQREDSSEEKCIRFCLYLKGNPICSTQKPQLRANCANRLSYDVDGNSYSVKYDDSGCYSDDENFIEVRFRFGNKIVSQKFYL